MRKKLRGLSWCPETGEGKIDKRVGGQRVQARIRASSWAAAETQFYRLIAGAKDAKPARQRTFREAATKYLDEANHVSADRDAGALVKLDPWIGSLELSAVHQGSLKPYIDRQRADGRKSATVARELAVVRRILSLAARLWRDADNQPWLPQAPLLAMPDWNDKARPHPLTWDEQTRLLGELPAHLGEMALFCLNTGAREAIISQLRWEWEIKVPELNDSVFLVPAEFTKNGTEFLLVLNSVARSIVETRRKDGGTHVFGYRGKPVGRMHNTAWKSAWKRAGLPVGPDVLSGPHNLRHTFARRLRAVGVPIETRKALMHHIDGDITVHYSPAEIGELIAAVERLNDAGRVTLLRRVG